MIRPARTPIACRADESLGEAAPLSFSHAQAKLGLKPAAFLSPRRAANA